MLVGNRTLDLFWRTVEACGIPEEEADKIIRDIERKHGVSIGILEKSHDYRLSNVVQLSNDDLKFIEHLKESQLFRDFCREYSINRSTLHKAFERKKVSLWVYSKFARAKENFRRMQKIEGGRNG